MESTVSFQQLSATSKHLAQRLMTIGENRLELLAVEIKEERDRLLHACLTAFGVAVLGLLAGLTLTAAIVIALWSHSPVAVLLILTALYGAAGLGLCRRLANQWQDRQTLSASFDQLRKDRVCLEKLLA